MLEIAKLIHDAIGIESPRKFILVCALVGAVLFACIGFLIDKSYRAKLKEEAKTSSQQVNGSATAGDGGIANTGNGNTINQTAAPEKPAKRN